MIGNIPLKRYKKEFEHSYSFGVFPTLELLRYRRESVLTVLLSSRGERNEGVSKIRDTCKRAGIGVQINDNAVERLAPNENSYAIGVFAKYATTLQVGANHVVLVNPSDMGNLGTIIRTMAGFGVLDLAMIKPGADIFDPRVIRASMGAVFQLRFEYFERFEEYRTSSGAEIYPFMTDGRVALPEAKFVEPFALVFGNEGAGLPEEFREVGTSVTISHTDRIDSLNLPVAVSIGLYEATKLAF